MAKKGNPKSPRKIVKLENLKKLNLNAAGLDIGAAEIWVCVPEDRDEKFVRVFETFTADLYALADWLEACGVDTVAMESTGIYWLPIYEILENRGFDLCLVNARHLKNVPGRKTDAQDCQWIQTLHTYGLLQGSFRPDEDIAALRAYVRHRDNLLKARVVHIQHMQKALELMNLKLTRVISDITGVTGLKIIRAIVDGERDPQKLAQFRNTHCAHSEADIAKALHGNYRPEHLFMLQQALQLFDFYNQQLDACDQEIEKLYSQFKPRLKADQPLEPPKPDKPRSLSKNSPDFPLRNALYQLAGVDLTRVDGLDVLTVQTILSETGVDMTPWQTDKHFASWLGLCPYNDKTGGKVIKRGSKKTKNRANTALRIAAQGVSNSNSALGAFYRRMRARHGPPKAITATAHKIARIIYSMLKYQREYLDPGADYYQQQYQKRALKNLKYKAARLGYQLVPNPA